MHKSSTREVYKLVATYVDNLAIVMDNPEEFLTQLQSAPYNFKLKGSGPMNFYLGCGFGRDPHGVLYIMDPTKYLTKMMGTFDQMFGRELRQCSTPLDEMTILNWIRLNSWMKMI